MVRGGNKTSRTIMKSVNKLKTIWDPLAATKTKCKYDTYVGVITYVTSAP